MLPQYAGAAPRHQAQNAAAAAAKFLTILSNRCPELPNTGKTRVGKRYVLAVLEACQLSSSWGAPPRRRPRRKRDDELLPSEIAGFDPETRKIVRRGSKRDKELQQKYVWWVPRAELG